MKAQYSGYRCQVRCQHRATMSHGLLLRAAEKRLGLCSRLRHPKCPNCVARMLLRHWKCCNIQSWYILVFATHLLANLCPLKITIESVNIAVLSMMHVVPPLRPSVALGVDASDPRRIVWTLEKASLTRCSATDIRTVLDT